MTTLHEDLVATWREPDAIAVRGTLIVLPGRGESPDVYERFGRRLSADAYRVHAVTAPSDDPERTDSLLAALVAQSSPDVPRVLVGSDAGALYAAQLAAQSRVEGLSALVLAGLPSGNGHVAAAEWDDELAARTSCPTHRGRISAGRVRPGELFTDIPTSWFASASPERVSVPVLGVHGADDTISALDAARAWYARVPHAELVSIAGGQHDALNDQTHRTVAATVVLFLERLRLGPALTPIAVAEALHQNGSGDRD